MYKSILFISVILSVSAWAQELPFDRALHQMIEMNVDLKVQQTKVNIAGDSVMAARAAFSPSFDLTATAKNANGNSPPFDGVSPYAGSTAYMANARWNLFRSGADVAGFRAASQDRSYQESLYDQAYLTAEDKAARALFDLIEKKQTLEALRKSEESVSHFLEIAQARFKKSLASREEADKVAVDASNTEARRTDAELEYNDALGTVEALLGHARVQLTWPWEKSLSVEQMKGYLGDDLRPLESRPDYLAARYSVEAEESRGRSAFRGLLPTVDMTYSIGETHTQGHTFSEWNGMAVLTVPLWSGLKDYSNYKAQVQNKYAAEARLEQLRRDVAGQVSAAQANFRLAVQTYQSRARVLGTARHILEQDEARFKIGRTDANELKNDLDRVTEAEIRVVQGIRQAHVSYMVLVHEFGKRAVAP